MGDMGAEGKLTWPIWNAYVESGATREERNKRLAEVPEAWREVVKRHVACEFKIRTRLARKRI